MKKKVKAAPAPSIVCADGNTDGTAASIGRIGSGIIGLKRKGAPAP